MKKEKRKKREDTDTKIPMYLVRVPMVVIPDDRTGEFDTVSEYEEIEVLDLPEAVELSWEILRERDDLREIRIDFIRKVNGVNELLFQNLETIRKPDYEQDVTNVNKL